MGVRPPSGNGTEEPDVLEFGIAALDARLAERPVEFPATTAELCENYGDVTVPVDASGTEITLREALDAVPKEHFESQQELLDVLHPVFEKRRQSSSVNVLAQLRALMPF